jgi:Tfp pilus assembly protein PilX
VIHYLNRLRRSGDEGVAMLLVIGIGLVVGLLVSAMFASILQTQKTTRTQRNVTSAQSAAEAGLNDAVYSLSQYDSSGQPNWTTLPTTWTQSSPHPLSLGANANAAVWVTSQTGTGNLIVWSKGTYAGNTRTLRAVVTQGSPPAFDFSMFASTGIDIHHHGTSWLSPQVWTTAVHSNGYINIDYSAEFSVNVMEAVGSLTFQKGGGSYTGGNIPAGGYNWYDPLNGKCFPGGLGYPGGKAPTNGVTTGAIQCPSMPQYSGNAAVSGTVQAGSVTIGSRGQVLPVTQKFQTETGQWVNAAPGDVTAGAASINGHTYTSATASSCTDCNKGTSAGAGQIAGKLTVTSGYKPATIAFPSINYADTYRPQAAYEQTQPGATQHVFSSSSEFLSYITNPANGFYRTISDGSNSKPANSTPVGTLGTWASKADGPPQAIFLDGTYDITGGSLQLNYGNIQKLVNAATATTGAAPMLIIRGSLVVEAGGVTLNTPLAMVGAGNRTDFVIPATATQPVSIDITKFLDQTASKPGVLAAGGSIESSDYDTDSKWDTSATYEPAKAAPTYIRGLVYSAKWDAATKTSVPQNQHWHNFDPKNLQKIYGAQVGGTLHDCNNFSFSYDPLIKRAFGFGGGNVKVIDYQELGK